MSDLHYEMVAFHDELVKEGAPPAFEVARRVLGGIASKAAPYVSKLRPGSVMEAAQMGVRGARAAGGMVAGGAGSVGKTLSQFGKRQLHGITGWKPKAPGRVSGRHGPSALESIGFTGSRTTGKALEAAKAAPAVKGKTGILQKVMYGQQAGSQALAQRVKKRAVSRAGKLHEATQASERMGLTSLPGWAKSMATRPGEAIKAGLGKEWHSGMVGKAMIGLPAVSAAHQLTKKPEAAMERGPGAGKPKGRLERAGRALGEVAWGMGMPIAPAILAAKGISTVAGGAGRLAGKLTGGREKVSSGRFAGKVKNKPELGKHPAPPTIDAGGQTQPSERIMTPAAQGKPPEDVIS